MSEVYDENLKAGKFKAARVPGGFCFADKKNIFISGETGGCFSMPDNINSLEFWQGKLFIGTSSGLYELNQKTKAQKLLAEGSVLDHKHDKLGNIYLSFFNKGLWIGKPNFFSKTLGKKDGYKLGFHQLKTVNDEMLITAFEYLYKWQNGTIEFITEVNEGDHITDFYFDSLGKGFILGGMGIYEANMYSGQKEKLSFMGKKKFVFSENVVKISENHFAFGGPWNVGFYKNGEMLYASGSDFGRRRNNPNRFSKSIYEIYKWNASTLLITGGTGSYLMDVNTYKWQRCEGTLGHCEIADYIPSNEASYFATYGKGLLIQEKDHLTKITEKDGLSSNFIDAMTKHKSKLYIAAGGEINIIDIDDEFRISKQNQNHGLNSEVRILDLCVFRDTLFIGTEDGLVHTNIEKLVPKISTDHEWHFNISLNGQPANAADLQLIDKSRNVEIEAYPIAPYLKGNVKVLYRIKELSTDFKEMKNNSVDLSAMKPGQYEISFKAIDGFSLTPIIDDITFPIHIKAKFHETIAFGIVITLICIALFYIYFSRVIYRLKQRNRLQAQLIQVEQHALKSQMNPHFMFNSLNSIQGYISKQDKVSAFTYISKFSRLIRWYLDNTTQRDVPIVEEVNALRDYLDLEVDEVQ